MSDEFNNDNDDSLQDPLVPEDPDLAEIIDEEVEPDPADDDEEEYNFFNADEDPEFSY